MTTIVSSMEVTSDSLRSYCMATHIRQILLIANAILQTHVLNPIKQDYLESPMWSVCCRT